MREEEKECWERLAFEIVRQACVDYIAILRAKDTYRQKSLEKWFRSEYCYSLCGINGDVIIKGLQKAFEENRRIPTTWAE